MIPSVLSNQVKKGVEDFLETTFPVAPPLFHGVMDRFLGSVPLIVQAVKPTMSLLEQSLYIMFSTNAENNIYNENY